MTAGKGQQHHIGDVPVFDAHLHIIDPRFPLVPNQGYLPEPFTVADYRVRTAGLPIVGGAVVSGSFQAFDQTYLLDALAHLGPSFVGVTQLAASAPDELILELDRAGVRAVRFNLRRGGSEPLDQLQALAHRVFALAGWHVELYLDGRNLPELEARLLRLPRVCIDHLGLHREGLTALLRLVEAGAKVKASGFGRVDLDVPSTARAIADVDPSALLFGTDLPSTRARRPFADADLAMLVDAVGPERAALALHDNAIAWYRPQQAQHNPER
jgi:predicted TIM-barrel fold metal-dependent hydrolase